jgi:hypothetical protein
MNKSRNWTGTANDRLREVGPISLCLANGRFRRHADLHHAPYLKFISDSLLLRKRLDFNPNYPVAYFALE